MSKVCKYCGVDLPDVERCQRVKRCKPCNAHYAKISEKKTKELLGKEERLKRRREYVNRYQANNKEQVSKKNKRIYERNKDRHRYYYWLKKNSKPLSSTE